MKEELEKRLKELNKQFEEMKSNRKTLLNEADLLFQKMQFLNGAIEELKLVIKNHFSTDEN